MDTIAQYLENYPWIWIVIAGIIILVIEIVLTIRYRRLASVAKENPLITRIQLSDSFPKDHRSSVYEMLRFQMDDIIKTFNKIGKDIDFHDTPVEIGNEFCMMMGLASDCLNLYSYEHPKDYRMVKEAMAKINIKIKFIEGPLNAFIEVLDFLINLMPAPYKQNYIKRRIYISINTLENEFQVSVSSKIRQTNPSEETDNNITKITTSLNSDVNIDEVFRDAAFMILELHNTAFPGLKWRGMRYFTDGLRNLEEYRINPSDDLYDQALQNFTDAVVSDKNEFEACCFLGSMLVSERRKLSITEAIKYFEKAIKTDRPKLKALSHAGLAHCYAQQYHRLGIRNEQVLSDAKKHADLAENIWRDSEPTTDPKPNSWINYIRAVTLVVDEGARKTPAKMKDNFIPAINLCYNAIKSDPKNKLCHNTLGWMLLKLTENNIIEFNEKDDIPTDLQDSIPLLAEKYLKKSLNFDENNKLSNANLCLLYATDHFRKEPERYLIDCKYHGELAIRLDPNYINGYRDLTISLIKYGKYDLAEKYYLKALEKALYPDKDFEIIEDSIKVLEEFNAPADIIDRFRNPPEHLLEVPDKE